MTRVPAKTFGALLALTLIAQTAPARAGGDRDDDDRDGQPVAELTWMSIANWYFKVGDVRIIMDGYYRLDKDGVTKVPNTAQKRKLGFADVQPFAAATIRAAAATPTTALPDDCSQ